MNRFAAVLVLALVLSGCAGKDGSEVTDTPDEPVSSDGSQKRDHQLHGWILDGKIQPIEGAMISIHGENVTSQTSEDGYFGFSGMPVDRLLTLQVEADGFRPQTRAVTLLPDTLMVVNFTLIPLPVLEPYMEKQSYTGHIGCSAVVKTQDSTQPYDCGIVSPVDNRVWEFNVNGNVASIIVEAFWNYDTELAAHLNLTVETVNLGIFDEELAYAEGTAPLQGFVTNAQSQRFYREGGTVRATIDIGRNIDQEEAGVGAGLAVDQEVQLIASVFYVAPAPPGYTAA